jgi:hypothetical protein
VFIDSGLRRQGSVTSLGSVGSRRPKASSPRWARFTDVADLGVGAGVVVAGSDEAAAVGGIDGDFVGLTGQPEQDAAGFAKLVAVVAGDSGRCGGAFGVSVGLGEDVRAGWWMTSRQ